MDLELFKKFQNDLYRKFQNNETDKICGYIIMVWFYKLKFWV